jgi:hypothetical protein
MYYGEEIGMTSPPYEVEKPDSDRRGPMCWSWPPVGGMPDPPPEWEWPELAPKSGKGVAQQLNDPASLLRHYIRVGNLKTRYPWLAYGKIESAAGIWNGGENGAESNSLCAYRLTNPDNPSQHLIIAHNTNYMDNQKITVKFDDYLDGIRAGGAEAAGIKYADAVTVWWPTGDGWTDGAWKGRFGGTGAEWTLGGYSTVIFADYVPAWAAE